MQHSQGEAEEVADSFTGDSAFDLSLAMVESLSWIEAVLQEKFQDKEDFHTALKDGQRLCKLLNAIRPKTVKRINKSTQPFPSMENCESFFNGCRASPFNLKDTILFHTTTFLEIKNQNIENESGETRKAAFIAKRDKIYRDVCINLYWLGVAVRQLPDWKGPQLNLSAFIKLSCTRCQQKIEEDDFIMAGAKNFHIKCFHCDICKKDPVDVNEDYMWDNYNEQLNCSKCRCVKCRDCLLPNGYRALNPNEKDCCKQDKICPVCDKDNQCKTCESVLNPDTMHTHEGNKYCPDCYCADNDCKKPFKNGKYNEIDGKRYCPDCCCENCKHLAGDDHIINPNTNKKVCKDCYCADKDCKKPFKNNQFKEVDGKRYCPDCFCENCHELAGEDHIKNPKTGKKVCKNCYCADSECKKPFVNNQFKEVDGKRYCPDCCCENCGKLAGDDFVKNPKTGNKVCHDCYCADKSCKKPFVNNEYKEVDGKRYCPDCMCHREGCGNWAGENPIIKDGKKYCPHCVCADEECGKPLITGEFVNVPASSDGKFKGGNVCKSCLCALCGVYVGKKSYLRRGGEKFCQSCCCGGCKVPLKEKIVVPEQAEDKKVNGIRFCKQCVCNKCTVGLKRIDKRHGFEGGQYCVDCVCAICKRATCEDDSKVPHGKASACHLCQCFSCKKGIEVKDRTKYGSNFFCSSCVCAGCQKPGTDVRGSLKKAGDKSYCQSCLCKTCETPVSGAARSEFGDYVYCSKCSCGTCHSPVEENKKVMKGPKSYCSKCFCVQCNDIIIDDKKVEYGIKYVTCLKCACGRCGKPEIVKGQLLGQAFIKNDGKGYCNDCICNSCDKTLKASEFGYCQKCTCESCRCLLDEDEDKFCDDCGSSSKPSGWKSRDEIRASKKAPKKEAKAAAAEAPVKSSQPAQPASNKPEQRKPSVPAQDKVSPAQVEGGCFKCGKALAGSVVKAIDQQFHKACFVCFGCESALSTGFMANEGKPYCKNCIGRAAGLPDCRGCGTTVSGSYISLSDNMSWHESCFNCGVCSKKIEGNDFKMNTQSNPICKSH